MSNNKKPISPKLTTAIIVIALLIITGIFNLGQDDSSSDYTSSDATQFVDDVEVSDDTDSTDLVIETESDDTVLSEDADETDSEDAEESEDSTYTPNLFFRNDNLLQSHYEKHGIEMGFDSAEEYEAAAARVTINPEAQHKTEQEDGDDVYFVASTGEFVVVSLDGYIRTYYYATQSYFDRQ